MIVAISVMDGKLNNTVVGYEKASNETPFIHASYTVLICISSCDIARAPSVSSCHFSSYEHFRYEWIRRSSAQWVDITERWMARWTHGGSDCWKIKTWENVFHRQGLI